MLLVVRHADAGDKGSWAGGSSARVSGCPLANELSCTQTGTSTKENQA